MNSRREKREHGREEIAKELKQDDFSQNGRTQISGLRLFTECPAHKWKMSTARDKEKVAKAPRDETIEELRIRASQIC